MKSLYLPVIAVAIALVAAAPASGQQPTPAPAPAPAAAAAKPPAPAPAPSPVLAVLLEGITLTAQQQHRVDSILTHFRTQAPPLTPDAEPDSATRVRILALSQVALDGVRNVLTRAQQQVWDSNAEHARAATLRVGP